MTRSPSLARKLLGLIPARDREFVEGDLEEGYAARLRGGALRADAWYWAQVLRTVLAFGVQRVVLLASRPGRVAGEWRIDETEGRRIESPEVAALSIEITAELRKEIRRNAA